MHLLHGAEFRTALSRVSTQTVLPNGSQKAASVRRAALFRRRSRTSGAPAAEGSAAQPEAQSAQPGVDAAALAEKDRELLIARAQLDAYREGIVAGAVEDAVYLAVMLAVMAGEADEEGVRDALKEVLKRHPEWKPQKKEAAKNGFKVGVDTTGADGKDGAGKRALPTGTVIL